MKKNDKKIKKLSLSKETLRSIGDTNLVAVVGGSAAKSNCFACTVTCP
jgi:hypothetical protein